jgi:hypothetical protein
MKYVDYSPEEVVMQWIKKGNPRRLLDLSSWILDDLPDIPDEVERLTLRNCSLNEIRKLPKNLKWLNCAESDIQSIQLPLPEHLEYIDCRWCKNLEPFSIPNHIKAKTSFVYILAERERETHNAEYFIQKWIREGKPNNVLDLSCMNLTELPHLPDTVRYLDCAGNPIQLLHNLPPNLRKLDCRNTLITEFQTIPYSLRYINCSGTNISTFVGLSDNIRYIIAENCMHLHVIQFLPSQLRRLYLYESYVNQIVYIPENVEYICLTDTHIKSLPKLPESLKVLRCDITPELESIVNLPSKLEVLELNTHKITSLPFLPDTLRCLHISSLSVLHDNTLPNSIEELHSNELILECSTYSILQYDFKG